MMCHAETRVLSRLADLSTAGVTAVKAKAFFPPRFTSSYRTPCMPTKWTRPSLRLDSAPKITLILRSLRLRRTTAESLRST